MPRYNQPRKTWQYTNEFKTKAVELTHLEDIKTKDVAKTFDIHPFMLSRWRKENRQLLQKRVVSCCDSDPHIPTCHGERRRQRSHDRDDPAVVVQMRAGFFDEEECTFGVDRYHGKRSK